MSRIDILTLERKYYTFENDSARKVQKVLLELDIPSQILSLQDRNLQEYLIYVRRKPPLWTLSFKDLLKRKTPLCEITQIPHFYWLRNTFSPAIHYLDANFSKIGCIDRSICRALDGTQVTFFPPAVELNKQGLVGKRPFNVVLFSKLIDVENKKKTWLEIFSKSERTVLEKQALFLHQNPSRIPLLSVLENKDGETMSRNDLLFGIEEYIKALRTRSIVESCPPDIPLDLFGEHVGKNWFCTLPFSNTIYLHGEVPYIEHFEILKETKILLIDHPENFDGVDEWFFAALANGALPLANPTTFLKEFFGDDLPFYYPTKDWKGMFKLARFFLENPQSRENLVDQLRKKITSHTWEYRTKELLKQMNK